MKSEVRPLWILGKALVLFVLINVIYAWIDPSLGKASTYNSLFPGRVRFPFGGAGDPYVVTVDDLDVLTASHALSRSKAPGEYRVVLIGDSSIWGEKIAAEESISEQWNSLDTRCNDREIRFYNLGYPHPSVIKDLIILDKAMEYEPDMVIWFVTLNTLIPRRFSPFLKANSERATGILDDYDIPFSQEDALAMKQSSFYEKTLVGKRSELARSIKLQVLGLLWLATGQDKRNSVRYPILSTDVEADLRYRNWEPGTNLEKKMLFNALDAGHKIAGSVPILIVNEPIFIAAGQNSDIRYNDIYPRWAFDEYREALAAKAQEMSWNYLDVWDAVPAGDFSDTGLHVSGEGERMLIARLNPVFWKIACP